GWHSSVSAPLRQLPVLTFRDQESSCERRREATSAPRNEHLREEAQVLAQPPELRSRRSTARRRSTQEKLEAGSMKIATKTMPVISTAQTNAMAGEWLSEQGEIAASHHRTRQMPLIHVASDIYSWQIYCGDEAANEMPGIPKTLQVVLRWAQRQGYDFVCLDEG